MKRMLIALIVIYAIIQTAYTGYFSIKSRTLVKTTYVGEKTLGDSKNPEFKLFVDGDSVGAGVGASSFETSVAGRVANYYAKDHHVKFVNNSVSGSRMETLIGKPIPSEKQDLTLLIISSNDLFHFSDLNEFRIATQKVLDKYSSNCAKLIIVGPGRVFDTQVLPFFIKPIYKSKGGSYASVISEESKKFPNVVYINPIEVSVSKREYGQTDASDGFHPNDEGHRFWFDLIKPHL